ncbi:MAG: hypothetical protein ACK517_01755, partial [bacterium]
MIDRVLAAIDEYVCSSIAANLVDLGLARKVVSISSEPIMESFSTSVQSFHAERTSRRSKK